jgi:hypothetical protein
MRQMPCGSPHCWRDPATDDDGGLDDDSGRDDGPGIDKTDDTFARNDKYRKAVTSSNKNRDGSGSADTSDENHYVDATTRDNGGHA